MILILSYCTVLISIYVKKGFASYHIMFYLSFTQHPKFYRIRVCKSLKHKLLVANGYQLLNRLELTVTPNGHA